MSQETMVTIRDARVSKQCSRGCRSFLKKSGFSREEIRDFFNGTGIPASRLVALDDAMVMQAVRNAEARTEAEQQ